MKTATPAFFRSLSADAIKLKRTPVLWIAILGGAFVSGLIFLIHFFSVSEINKPDTNPWTFYCEFGVTITSVLFVVPYVVLVCSSVLYTEHRADSWKYLYALPLRKGQVYFSKVATVMGLIAMTYFIFFMVHLLSGWVLGFLRPAYEFHEYRPDTWGFVQSILHSYISTLGVVGLHFWLSVRWKSFIAPLGIGLMGYIISIIISMAQKFDVGKFFPYAYPAMVGNEIDSADVVQMGWLTNVEVFSIGFFVLFVMIGFMEESRRNVK